jgi:hypothetical protein
MAKPKIPIEAEYKGLRKALRNPRTPKQFRPALEKRLAHVKKELGIK